MTLLNFKAAGKQAGSERPGEPRGGHRPRGSCWCISFRGCFCASPPPPRHPCARREPMVCRIVRIVLECSCRGELPASGPVPLLRAFKGSTGGPGMDTPWFILPVAYRGTWKVSVGAVINSPATDVLTRDLHCPTLGKTEVLTAGISPQMLEIHLPK